MAEVHPLTLDMGTIQRGAWCGPCALPSAVTSEVLDLTPDGIEAVAQVSYCPECGNWERLW